MRQDIGLQLRIDRRQGPSLPTQIKNQFKGLVLNGTLMPGDGIPSVRELVSLLGVSHVVAARAVSDLVAEGVLEKAAGRGAHVAEGVRSLNAKRVDAKAVVCVPVPSAAVGQLASHTE